MTTTLHRLPPPPTPPSSHRRGAATPSSRRAPGPRRRWFGEHVVALAKDKLGLFAEMSRHGDVTEVSFGPKRAALLMHPDDIQRVLVSEARKFSKGLALGKSRRLLGNGLLTSEGEFHLRQRRLVQPAFHRERLASYAAAMVEATERLQDDWYEWQERDLHADMMRLTLTIAGRALFDTDVEGDVHDVAEALDLSLRMANLQILPFGELMERIPLRWVRDLHRARAKMNALIFRLIAERQAAGTDRGDLLSMLVAARDAEGDGTGMSDQLLRDEVVTLLMAAHETTANALAWAWYLLSRYPSAEARLHRELDQVLGGRAPTAEDLPRLPYTRAVLAETLRVYPPAWILERMTLEPFEAGGYTIRPGTTVLMCQYLVHRDHRWWEEPDRFNPGRWLENTATLRPKFAYFPFGAGTRICVGEHFAWMEGTLVLATLAQRWKLLYRGRGAPVPEPLITLRPRGGMPMRLARR